MFSSGAGGLAVAAIALAGLVALISPENGDRELATACSSNSAGDAGGSVKSGAPERSVEMPAPKLLNPGIVDDDPIRHDAILRETAPVGTIDAVTADDDLDPSGTLSNWYPEGKKTYRTVCVRLCDGAITPISFATSRDRFALDALRCKKSCNSPTALFVQRNPAPDLDKLVDLDGRPYSALPTANQFRTNYDSTCSCRPHAWQESAKVRHRILSVIDKASRTRRQTYGMIASLKTAVGRSRGMVAVQEDRQRLARMAALARSADDHVAVTAARPAATAPTDSAASMARGVKARKTVTATGRPVRQALVQAKQGKARKRSGATVVIWNVVPDNSGAELAEQGKKQAARSSQHASAGQRRFDGTDWRISQYEPL